MSDIEKLRIKVQLELDLKTPEDIQQWAMHALASNTSNEFALDLCFHLAPMKLKII